MFVLSEVITADELRDKVSQKKQIVRTWLVMLNNTSAIKKMIDSRLRREFGISISRFDVLAALDRAGPAGLNAGALTEKLMVTYGNTTQIVTPLVRDGYVLRTRSKEDGRSVLFQLTSEGQAIFKKMAKKHHEWLASAFSELSAEDLDLLQGLLKGLSVQPDSKALNVAAE
ncbi:MAG: MarR family transcriptional regulator [Hyphomonadaceae bacterium]|nr:MarR family transcriptional regulator [Hyphomonadaceae bacterium]